MGRYLVPSRTHSIDQDLAQAHTTVLQLTPAGQPSAGQETGRCDAPAEEVASSRHLSPTRPRDGAEAQARLAGRALWSDRRLSQSSSGPHAPSVSSWHG